MRRLFQVMATASTLQHPAIAISLDAVKAFDRLEWHFFVLRYVKITVIISWVKPLYINPSASIKTNGTISKPLQLLRSTTQGCPAWPSLFILALEPLVCAIQAERKITGIQIGGHDFKDNLFADDLLLTLS